MRNARKDEIDMAARREAMLREGFRLFAERGIEAVFMQEIADACGLGLATVYRYYSNKLALVIAIATRKWQDYAEYAKERIQKLDEGSMTAAEELDFYFDFYIDLYRNHKELLRFNQNFNNYVRHEGASPEQLQPYLKAVGADGDGSVTFIDVSVLSLYLMGAGPIAAEYLPNADFDGDGEVSFLDISQMYLFLIG